MTTPIIGTMTPPDLITTRTHLDRLLARITFAPSAIGLHTMHLAWEVRELALSTGRLVRLTFLRPDTMTGVEGRGFGRWELVEQGTSESGAAKTCWLLLELLVRHELMESFMVDGVRVFDPHRTIEELSGPRRTP